MYRREYRDFLDDIHKSIVLIKEFTNEINFTTFEKDIKTQYAVIRCFEIIGEAVKKLPLELRERNSDIPWALMAGMRDRLIHGYDTVDTGILWRTISMDVLPLANQITKIVIADDDS